MCEALYSEIYDLLKSYNEGPKELTKEQFYDYCKYKRIVELQTIYFYIDSSTYCYTGRSNKRYPGIKSPISKINKEIHNITERFKNIKSFW